MLQLRNAQITKRRFMFSFSRNIYAYRTVKRRTETQIHIRIFILRHSTQRAETQINLCTKEKMKQKSKMRKD